MCSLTDTISLSPLTSLFATSEPCSLSCLSHDSTVSHQSGGWDNSSSDASLSREGRAGKARTLLIELILFTHNNSLHKVVGRKRWLNLQQSTLNSSANCGRCCRCRRYLLADCCCVQQNLSSITHKLRSAL